MISPTGPPPARGRRWEAVVSSSAAARAGDANDRAGAEPQLASSRRGKLPRRHARAGGHPVGGNRAASSEAPASDDGGTLRHRLGPRLRGGDGGERGSRHRRRRVTATRTIEAEQGHKLRLRGAAGSPAVMPAQAGIQSAAIEPRHPKRSLRVTEVRSATDWAPACAGATLGMSVVPFDDLTGGAPRLRGATVGVSVVPFDDLTDGAPPAWGG